MLINPKEHNWPGLKMDIGEVGQAVEGLLVTGENIRKYAMIASLWLHKTMQYSTPGSNLVKGLIMKPNILKQLVKPIHLK